MNLWARAYAFLRTRYEQSEQGRSERNNKGLRSVEELVYIQDYIDRVIKLTVAEALAVQTPVSTLPANEAEAVEEKINPRDHPDFGKAVRAQMELTTELNRFSECVGACCLGFTESGPVLYMWAETTRELPEVVQGVPVVTCSYTDFAVAVAQLERQLES